MRIDLNSRVRPSPGSNRGGASDGWSSSSGSNLLEQSGREEQANRPGADNEVQALAARVFLLPEIRRDRVDFLSQAVANGQYETSPEKVADAMVEQAIVGSPRA